MFHSWSSRSAIPVLIPARRVGGLWWCWTRDCPTGRYLDLSCESSHLIYCWVFGEDADISIKQGVLVCMGKPGWQWKKGEGASLWLEMGSNLNVSPRSVHLCLIYHNLSTLTDECGHSIVSILTSRPILPLRSRPSIWTRFQSDSLVRSYIRRTRKRPLPRYVKHPGPLGKRRTDRVGTIACQCYCPFPHFVCAGHFTSTVKAAWLWPQKIWTLSGACFSSLPYYKLNSACKLTRSPLSIFNNTPLVVLVLLPPWGMKKREICKPKVEMYLLS